VDRKTEHHRLHSFPRWGDELRCSIDGERGILLRSATLLDGDEFRSGELSDLVFDQPIPPETFVLEPPEGETFASLGHHEIGPVTLQEAVERASFKMFAIRKLPEGDWRIRVHYAAGTQRPMPESVHMHYMREDAQQQLSLSESPADAAGSGWPEGFNEDAVVRAGITYLVHTGEAGAFGPPATVRFERDGTRIVLTSQELDVEALLELAGEMVEASG
jgi:hypothetical protein